MTEPLYVAHDNATGADLCAPTDRVTAGKTATEYSIRAGRRGERVAMPGGTDRFTVKRAPAPASPAPVYSSLEVEAALCLYEAMLDARLEGTSPAIVAAFENSGSATMRSHAVNLAGYALAVYDLIPEADRECRSYDFEIIPAILKTVRWTHVGYILPEVADGARDAASDLRASA